MQRGVQEMRGGVIAHDVVTAAHIHFGDGFIAHFGLTRDDFADVDDDARRGAAHGGDFDLPTLPPPAPPIFAEDEGRERM